MSRLPLILLSLFIPVVIASGISPINRSNWLLENVLVFVSIPILVLTARRLPLSNAAYLCLFGFLCFHELGAHYAYANVPYQTWFGWEQDARNHFDRAAHFLFGLLILVPVHEWVDQQSPSNRNWNLVVALSLILSSSLVFELLEWAAAEVFGGELGHAFLGSQGDPWDAQKDMALAGLGGLITAAWLRWRRDR